MVIQKLSSLIIIAQLIVGTAFADTGSTQFRLIGKGVHNKEGDAIALACQGSVSETSDGCDELQFVYFDHNLNLQPRSFGAVFKSKSQIVNDQENQSFRKNVEKITKHNFKLERKEERKQRKKTWRGLIVIFGSIVVGGVAAVILNTSFPLVLATIPVVKAASSQSDPAIFDIFPSLGRDLFVSNEGVVNAILNQDGWNWIEHSRKLGPNKFRSLYESIQNAHGTYLVDSLND